MKYARWFGLPDKTEFKRLLMAINFVFFLKKIQKIICSPKPSKLEKFFVSFNWIAQKVEQQTATRRTQVPISHSPSQSYNQKCLVPIPSKLNNH